MCVCVCICVCADVTVDLTKIRLTPNEMRDGRLGVTHYHNNHCDLVLSAIGFERTTDLDLDREPGAVEGEGRLLEADCERVRVGSRRDPVAGRRRAQRLCCFGYGPTRTLARGLSRL